MKRSFISLLVIVSVIAFSLHMSAFAQAPADVTLPEATYILPSSLLLIEEEAFEGTAVKTVILPYGLLWIGNSAFANTQGLTDIYIPSTTRHISETAFSSNENYVIHGVKGSYAEKWAKKQKIPFVVDDIWKHILNNGKTVSVLDLGIHSLHRTVNPDRTLKNFPTAEDDIESKRPQDRPELNPIDYRFP